MLVYEAWASNAIVCTVSTLASLSKSASNGPRSNRRWIIATLVSSSLVERFNCEICSVGWHRQRLRRLHVARRNLLVLNDLSAPILAALLVGSHTSTLADTLTSLATKAQVIVARALSTLIRPHNVDINTLL